MLDRLVGQRTKLNFYFVLNFLSLVSALFVSYKAALFFFLFIFGIWFYSHKLKKYPFIGNLVAATLAVIPLFAVFIYYKNFDLVIFVHATFLFIIISMRELVKDLENLKRRSFTKLPNNTCYLRKFGFKKNTNFFKSSSVCFLLICS